MTERIYRYPDGTRQALGGSLDDVPVANATERTAPTWTTGGSVTVDSVVVYDATRYAVDPKALTRLLDAWQAYLDANEPGPDVEGPAYAEAMKAQAWDGLLEALADFADGVDGL